MNKKNKPTYMDHFREVTNTMMNGIIEMVKHPDGSFDIVYANEAVGRMLCRDSSEATEKLDADPYSFVYPADRNRIKGVVERSRTNENQKETYRVIDKEGHITWVLAHFHSILVGEEVHIVIVYSNISELMDAQAALHAESDKLQDIINSIPMGLAIFEIDDKGNSAVQSINNQLILFANRVGTKLDGNSRDWSKEEFTILLNQSIYVFCVNEDRELVSQMLEESKIKEISSCIFRLRGSTEDNAVYVRSTCCSKAISDNSRNYYVTFEDITQDRLQELELEKNRALLYEMSYTDALTGTRNRNAYNIFAAKCKKNIIYKVGIIFADINGLKQINDVLGHQQGDAHIIKFANMLNQYFDEESVFRISGDEFVCVCYPIERLEFKNKMDALIHEIEENDNLASIGYTWIETVDNIKPVVDQAEQIMYVEKQKYYEMMKNLKSKHRPILLNSLLDDLENKRFKMFLQPKADVKTSKIIGAEALVRKYDEDGQIVPPNEFVPQLEEERLIPKIDFFILEEACVFLEKLKKSGNTDFVLSVNMSRVTLVENDYLKSVKEIIDKYDFNIEQLEFEITESNETMDAIRLEEYVRKIKALGISIALDDVGTKFSSLPMLLLDGIDIVKLDRSFVEKGKSIKASRMLKYISKMCHSIGLRVVAEGVETEDILDGLNEIDCDFYQGFLLSKPVPVEEFVKKFMTEKTYTLDM